AIKKSERVLVMGDGKLALLCAFVLKLTGCELTVVGKHMDKLLKLKDIKVKTVLIDDLKSKEFDVVVEATGSSGGISTALTLVRPRGTVILKSTVRSNRVADLNKAVIDEITIIGSRCGPFKEALRALKEKKLDVTRLIEETYPLEEGVKAIKHAKIKGTLKVLIKND
ncbi:MAG: alcohol dehydrogenase, partial [Deltaproteobacteria bacterium]|nr:alcohol dehydrogenase [Deltaproteobacteria bacterium]